MPDYDDDRRDDDRFEDDRGDPGRDADLIRRAREKVSTPATLLLVAGVIMFLGWFANIALVASGYDLQVAMLEYFEGMAQGQQKQDLQKQIAEAKARDKTVETVQNVAGVAIGLVFNTIVVLGAVRMKGLKSYGLAMAAAICGMIPCNSCCCVGLPAGLWAVIVLANADVKAGFGAARRSPAGGGAE